MFSTLESSWDKSARRGWSAAASFGFQALALSLLLAIPMFWVQGPPSLHWLHPLTMPVAPASEPLPIAQEHYRSNSVSNILNNQLITPQHIPRFTAQIDDHDVGPAPELPNVGFGPGVRGAVPYIGNAMPVVTPKPPPLTRPIRVSRWAEGNLIYRVQPVYPPIAKQAGIQGAVQLRAIISKTGTIEQLTVESGHPMLSRAAIEAVRQWRYRPYLLNDEPIAIETEVTVNFVLARN